MHESFKRRIAHLEEARALANGPPQTISINFVHGDGTPVVPTVARSGNSECYRNEGEEEAAFRARAHAEAREADPRPLQILIFSDQEEETLNAP
jgi:hypothetical protein